MMRNHCWSKFISWLLLASLLIAFGPATGTTQAAQPDQIEPGAGQWQTWVLEAGSELRPAAPPTAAATRRELSELRALVAQRSAEDLAQIAYWDAGAPNYRWVELALKQAQSKPISFPRVVRLYALMNVAIYDGMVAAWDAKYTYNRKHPSVMDPRLDTVLADAASPSYPSEHAVAAGAAAAILSYVYPDDAEHFADLAEAAGRSRLLAGVNYPSDVSAGLELGRAVAAKVIERAQADGSDTPWTGTVPTGPGKWIGDNPHEPGAATWQPWVLGSADQVRVDPPPAYDSAQIQSELEELRTYERTFPSNYRSMFWQSFDGINTFWFDWASRRIFEQQLDANPPRAARVYALLSVAQVDALIACWDSKYAYWMIRPSQLDPTLNVLFPPPPHPSYPAAHSCNSTAKADVLAYLFPSDAQAITAYAEEAGLSRIWAGIHYRSDIEAGTLLGHEVAELVIAHAQQDGAQRMP